MATTKTSRTHRVMDYDNGSALDGTPTPDLVEQSKRVSDSESGAVPAYVENGVWHYVQPSQEDHYRRNLGVHVRTVYVEG